MNENAYLKKRRAIQRQIDRYTERVNDLKANRDHLSVHGYWSIGYFEGVISQYENTLDLLKDIYEGKYD